MKKSVLAVLALLFAVAPLQAQDVPHSIAGLRGEATLGGDTMPPPIARTEDSASRRVRNYPEQPPTIPHEIDGYQVTRNANKCLSCHARARTQESGAPMVSITHFMDRDGQFLAAISPRRYFCNQCHVTQQRIDPAVANGFVDIDSLLAAERDKE
ncbi:nitrate reductase cytochrome c-type subunit [Oceanibacterium hippocampi]|uniref:Periplasmic nitrate reductase, electron transfer subunit n=1 Tax=Oceanibacterium hippocampi TaxID=745714 RepID=A0A1Y5TIE7_9PROT|nr:nitrate reductase cytochrome c-type subunit [Oceanibacterium hippocampi]SLN62733.1 Periplasmic nitrate reductase, electron transfer subunit precursor [Oceanibacterium hippocampi]